MTATTYWVDTVRLSDAVGLICTIATVVCVLIMLYKILLWVRLNIVDKTARIVTTLDKERDEPRRQFERQLGFANKFRAVSSVDCESQPVSCTTNEECLDKCQLRSRPYTCDETRGVCYQFDAAAADNTSIPLPETKCNPRHGILALLRGDVSQNTATWTCLSLYREYFTDYDDPVPTTCAGGKLDVDISRAAPSWRDCQCPPNWTRVIANATDWSILSSNDLQAKKSLALSMSQLPRCVRYAWLTRTSLKTV